MTTPRSRWDERYGSQKFTYGAFEAFAGAYQLDLGLPSVTGQTVITNGSPAEITGVRSLHVELAAYAAGASATGVLAIALVKFDSPIPSTQLVTPDALRVLGATVYRYRLVPFVPQSQHVLGTGVKAISLKQEETLRLVYRILVATSVTNGAPLRVSIGVRYSEGRVLHG